MKDIPVVRSVEELEKWKQEQSNFLNLYFLEEIIYCEHKYVVVGIEIKESYYSELSCLENGEKNHKKLYSFYLELKKDMISDPIFLSMEEFLKIVAKQSIDKLGYKTIQLPKYDIPELQNEE